MLYFELFARIAHASETTIDLFQLSTSLFSENNDMVRTWRDNYKNFNIINLLHFQAHADLKRTNGKIHGASRFRAVADDPINSTPTAPPLLLSCTNRLLTMLEVIVPNIREEVIASNASNVDS